MKIKFNKLSPNILSLKKKEYKYLSPHIFNFKKFFYLLYCNRKDRSKFYGQINFAISKNLKEWKKKNEIVLSPKKSGYISYVSPAICKINNCYYLFVEAQKKDKSSIIVFFSKNLKRWKLFSKFKLEDKINSFHSPFIIKIKKNIHIFYSFNKKKISCLVVNQKFQTKKKFECINSSYINEKFCIYSPSIIRHDNDYIMLYAAWKNNKEGNINCAISKNGILWKKIKKNIFKRDYKIKIISEPFVTQRQNKIFIFFEYKFKNYWNITSVDLDKKKFFKDVIGI